MIIGKKIVYRKNIGVMIVVSHHVNVLQLYMLDLNDMKHRILSKFEENSLLSNLTQKLFVLKFESAKSWRKELSLVRLNDNLHGQPFIYVEPVHVVQYRLNVDLNIRFFCVFPCIRMKRSKYDS